MPIQGFALRAALARAAPYAAQFARGFGRGVIPVYGSMSNLYISRTLGKLGVARVAGGVASDLTVGGMTAVYIHSKLKQRRSPSSGGGRARRGMSRRYLEEIQSR
jgi:hypothetical protein